MNPLTDHVWYVAEHHLFLIESESVAPPVRAFAVQIVSCALEHDSSERLLARTFEVLRRLVDRDDPLVGELLPSALGGNRQATRAALRRLASRAIERRHRGSMTAVAWAIVGCRSPVPTELVKALLDATPDDELAIDFAYLFFEWATFPGVDAGARDEMLNERPTLRQAHADVREAFGGYGRGAE